MYRYELRCRECGATIGYMSSPYDCADNNYVLSCVLAGDTVEPICCPTCEKKRKKNDTEVHFKSDMRGE